MYFGLLRTVYKLSTAHKDVTAFMKLTDSVFEMILYWVNGNAMASRIFDTILRRDLYKCVGYMSKTVSQVSIPFWFENFQWTFVYDSLGCIK